MKIPRIKGFDEAAFEKYLKNTGWLMLARVGSLGIKIFAGIAVSNYLGKDHFGMLNYASAFVTFFTAAAALGLDGFVTRELLREPERKDQLLGSAFLLKLAGGITIIPLIYLAYQALNHAKPIETPLTYVMIVSFSGVLQAFNIIDSYFQSRTQGKFIMKVQVAGNILSALLKVALILLQASLTWFVYALLTDFLFLAIGYVYLYHSHHASLLRWEFDRSTATYLLKKSWPLAFSAILVTIYLNIDQLMIEYYLGSGPLGIYSTVVSLAGSWYFIPVAIVSSVFPAIMNARRDDRERYLRRMQDLYDLMVWISMSLAIVISFSAPLIFRLFYTPEYHSGAGTLSIHIWAGIFAFLGTASGQFLIAEGYVNLSLLRTAAGAVINILLNILWIPRYGISGAALATLIAYAASAFWILFIPRTRQQGIMMLKSLFLVSLFRKLNL